MPRFGMCRFHRGFFNEAFDGLGGEVPEGPGKAFGEKGWVFPIEGLKMAEEEDEFFCVEGSKFFVGAVECVSDGVGNIVDLKVFLDLVEIGAKLLEFGMVLLGEAPKEEVDFAPILREMSDEFFAKKNAIEVKYLEATFDGIDVGEGDEGHASGAEFVVEVTRLGAAGWEFEATENPVGSRSAVEAMDVEVYFSWLREHGFLISTYNSIFCCSASQLE